MMNMTMTKIMPAFPFQVMSLLFKKYLMSWWRDQIKTLSALLAHCAGNSPVTGEVPSQMPVTRSFDVFFVHLNKRLGKQSWRRWFEMPSRSLWRHCNALDAGRNWSFWRLAMQAMTKIMPPFPFQWMSLLFKKIPYLQNVINKFELYFEAAFL